MRIACLLFLALACTTTATAQTSERREVPEFQVFGAPARSEDAAAIDAVLRGYLSAWGKQDTAALMALHASDVEWINAYARMFRSNVALGQFLEKRLFPAMRATVSEDESFRMKPLSVRYIGADAAVAHFYTDSQRGDSRNEAEDARRTHIHLVLARQQNGWRIVHCAIMDAR